MDERLVNNEELLKELTALRQRVKDLEALLENNGKADHLILLQKMQFKELFEEIELGVALLDAQERIIHVNKKFENIFQYSDKEIKGLYINDLIIPAHLKEEANNVSNKVARNEVVIKETLRKRKDGVLINVRVHGVPAVIEGRQKGAYAVYEDITEYKNSETLLQKSSAQLSNALKAAKMGHWEYDAVSDLFTFNDHFYSLFRTSVEKEGGYMMSSSQYAERFLPPEIRPQLKEAILKALDTTAPDYNQNHEHPVIFSDGEKGHVSVNIYISKDETGKTVKISGVNRDITEQKQIEEKLEQERILLKTLINNLPDGIYVKDAETRKVVSNPADVKNIGKESEKEVIGKTDFDFFPKEIAQKCFEDDLFVLKTGQPVLNREEFVLHENGEKRWLLTSKLPLKDKTGNITGLIGMGKDITAQKKIEEKLQQERLLLKTLINNLPDGIYIKDRETRKLVSNPADIKNIGKESEEEVIGKTDFDFFPKEIAQKFFEDDLFVLKTGQPVLNREEFVLHENGEKRWLLTSKLPFRDQSGNIIGIIGIGRDITEQKQTEEKLQEERILLKTIINNHPDGIFVKDLETRKIISNPAHIDLTGKKTEEEVLGTNDFELFPKELAEKFFEDDQSVIKKGRPILNREEYVLNEKREKRWLLTSKLPLKDPSGKIIGLVGISRDITEYKNAEEAIKEAYDELEQKNSELVKANLIKNQFLANMSHEIRTPLNAIIGLTSLLLDTPLNREQKDFTETIHNSGDILLTLINDILDFSKIEAQKIELEKQPFDLRSCIEEALDIVASKAVDKDIELAYSMDESLPQKIIGDVTRLRQILVNLLSNSIKFTDEGEVVVSLSGQLRDHNGYQLHFAIRDTGLGIPQEKQSRLFQSFTQVDSSTTRKYGGTGLGLAISRQLSELMGGTMWIESSGIAGEGSTFHFTILCELLVEKQVSRDNSALAGKKVLIVDDNKTNREILIKQTHLFEMIPAGAASGNEALDLLNRENGFDLAILDFHMPGMDGVMLSGEIRKIGKCERLPLILLSSYGYRDKISDFPAFAATLTKPIKLSQLHNALLTVMKKNGAVVRQYENTPTVFDSEIGRKHPLRILLAEDNIINQKVALRFLERIGYRADIAFNGIEVMDALNRQSYDLILMDIQMPEKDGVQATLEIRKEIPPERQPRIIAMTANAMKDDHEKYLTIGIDGCIVKPFKLEELVKALLETNQKYC